MDANDPSLYRALKTRDARFDGRFYTCVRTTKIYCRPVCPARTPLRKNCTFVPSAAAAHALGYRPCLRCRPELAPGLPAARGTAAVVQRALRLVASGALDGAGVDALAEKAGMTARHLRRLFKTHAGASPVELARARRVLFAKRLIAETRAPITEIAFASGFQSLRRFNSEIAATLGRPPRALRKAQHEPPADVLALPLSYRAPYDFPGMRDFFALRCVPGVEHMDGDVYHRKFSLDGASGQFSLTHEPAARRFIARIEIDRLDRLDRLLARIRAQWDLDADSIAAQDALARDPLLKPAFKGLRGLRVPQFFEPFEAGVRAIAGQHISVKAAVALLGRLAARAGGFPDAKTLLATDLDGIGFTKARQNALIAFARFAKSGGIENLPPGLEETIAALKELPGIGDWTAQEIALRGLAFPDAFPSGDLALRRVLDHPTARELAERSQAWSPWRAYAAQALWRLDALNQDRKGPRP